LLDKPLRTLKFENIMDNDFTECLRQEILKWACTLNHPVTREECTVEAHHELHLYHQNPEKYP